MTPETTPSLFKLYDAAAIAEEGDHIAQLKRHGAIARDMIIQQGRASEITLTDRMAILAYRLTNLLSEDVHALEVTPDTNQIDILARCKYLGRLSTGYDILKRGNIHLVSKLLWLRFNRSSGNYPRISADMHFFTLSNKEQLNELAPKNVHAGWVESKHGNLYTFKVVVGEDFQERVNKPMYKLNADEERKAFSISRLTADEETDLVTEVQTFTAQAT